MLLYHLQSNTKFAAVLHKDKTTLRLRQIAFGAKFELEIIVIDLLWITPMTASSSKTVPEDVFF